MLFGVVDTWFMGQIGTQAIAAVGLGHAIGFALYAFGIGLLYGVDALVSRAMGAGEAAEAARVYFAAMILAVVISCVFFLLLTFGAEPLLKFVGVEANLVRDILIYLDVLRWVYFPGLLFVASRQYLQAHGYVWPLVAVLALANILNYFFNNAFALGNYGFPRWEIYGAGVATILANWALTLITAALAIRRALQGLQGENQWFKGRNVSALLKLGIPGGGQTLLEVGVFAFVSLLIGRFGATTSAAHQITLNLASLTFMIPMGLSYAAAVRIGFVYGAKRLGEVGVVGTAAMLIGGVIMTTTSSLFLLFPSALLSLYTSDATVLAVGVPLLRIAGIFQLVDGAQIVLTGMLRGLGDTKSSLFANLIAHWCVGFPLGYYLAFHGGAGASGLWIGLCVGLAIVASILTIVWRRRASALVA